MSLKLHRQIFDTRDGELVVDFIPTPSGKWLIEAQAPSEDVAEEFDAYLRECADKLNFDPDTGESL